MWAETMSRFALTVLVLAMGVMTCQSSPRSSHFRSVREGGSFLEIEPVPSVAVASDRQLDPAEQNRTVEIAKCVTAAIEKSARSREFADSVRKNATVKCEKEKSVDSCKEKARADYEASSAGLDTELSRAKEQCLNANVERCPKHRNCCFLGFIGPAEGCWCEQKKRGIPCKNSAKHHSLPQDMTGVSGK